MTVRPPLGAIDPNDEYFVVEDSILVAQKDFIYNKIIHLAELQIKVRDVDNVLNGDEFDSTWDIYYQVLTSISNMLELLKPMWEAASYGYKHIELLQLFERAQNTNPDGTW